MEMERERQNECHEMSRNENRFDAAEYLKSIGADKWSEDLRKNVAAIMIANLSNEFGIGTNVVYETMKSWRKS